MDSLKNISSVNLQKSFSSFSPFARKTMQLVRQTIGTADERTELPEEYLMLEHCVECLKSVHTKILSVTSTYSNESYDYPTNLRETFNDLSKAIQEKVYNLSMSHSATEMQEAIFKSPTKNLKTFNHALSRAFMISSELLDPSNPLKKALELYADAQHKIGNARISQDQRICTTFNDYISSCLNTIFAYTTKAKKNVQSARLSLDALKSSAKTAKLEKQEQLCREIEQSEDLFVSTVEEATQIMKNALETSELILQLQELINAQLDFHKEAYEILSNLSITGLTK